MKHGTPIKAGEVVWAPAQDALQTTEIGRYARWLERTADVPLTSYDELQRWSVDSLEAFWPSLFAYFDIQYEGQLAPTLTGRDISDVRWFPNVELNLVERVEQMLGDGVAIVGISETRGRSELSGAELRTAVTRARGALSALGVVRGDRVVGVVPNIQEAVVAYLATASLGAVWSMCSPDMGVESIVARLGQLQPKVLFTVDGYRYAGKAFPLVDRLAELPDRLAVREHVLVPFLDPDAQIAGARTWEDFLSEAREDVKFERVPFETPLFIVYSSGTTGLPKPIVHGHGGILLEHLKALALHYDTDKSSTFFWYTTTSWIMWHIQVSALLTGARIVLFDGDPFKSGPGTLWKVAAEERVTFFGSNPGIISATMKAGVDPFADYDLSRLRGVGSTGAPLGLEAYEWFYAIDDGHRPLVSGSGGTDVASGLVCGCPLVPVYAGEISCRALGCAVDAVDSEGRHVAAGVDGEMVLSAPLPSMPVGFWDDPHGSRRRDAYFKRFPGLWHQGDWIRFTDHGTCVISGRSDATLNRGGVRLGSADFYPIVESMEPVLDSLILHLDAADGGALVLCVSLTPGVRLDDDLERRLREALRTKASPRHVPDHIVEVEAIPRLATGKKLELPVKKAVLGARTADVVDLSTLLRPEAFDQVVYKIRRAVASPRAN